MKDDQTFAYQANMRSSSDVGQEVRETDETVHDHHNHRFVEVLHSVQAFVLHAECVSSDDSAKNDVENETRDLEEQVLTRIDTKHANHQSS